MIRKSLFKDILFKEMTRGQFNVNIGGCIQKELGMCEKTKTKTETEIIGVQLVWEARHGSEREARAKSWRDL